MISQQTLLVFFNAAVKKHVAFFALDEKRVRDGEGEGDDHSITCFTGSGKAGPFPAVSHAFFESHEFIVSQGYVLSFRRDDATAHGLKVFHRNDQNDFFQSLP